VGKISKWVGGWIGDLNCSVDGGGGVEPSGFDSMRVNGEGNLNEREEGRNGGGRSAGEILSSRRLPEDGGELVEAMDAPVARKKKKNGAEVSGRVAVISGLYYSWLAGGQAEGAWRTEMGAGLLKGYVDFLCCSEGAGLCYFGRLHNSSITGGLTWLFLSGPTEGLDWAGEYFLLRTRNDLWKGCRRGRAEEVRDREVAKIGDF